MKKLLYVGDANCASGFARVTHNVLHTVKDSFEVQVVGVNHFGDPHSYPYDIYAAFPGGDSFGVGRTAERIKAFKPDVVIIQTDPWNVPAYLSKIKDVPVIGMIAIDGLHCPGADMNGLSSAIFWTKFAEREARKGGYTKPSFVVPLGVDQSVYHPVDKTGLREFIVGAAFRKRGFNPDDSFIVGTVAKNQPRKRIDLTIECFAEWVHTYKIPNAVLWLHVGLTAEFAYDIKRVGDFYGITERIATPNPHPVHGDSEAFLNRIYNLFDVFLLTSLGEGWGLPVLEAMACGVPCVVPDWSALGEWAAPAACLIPCSEKYVHPTYNTVGGVMDRAATVRALQALYVNPELREAYGQRGLMLTSRPEYRWAHIGAEVVAAVWQTLGMPQEVACAG